jgi:hypothetical protein
MRPVVSSLLAVLLAPIVLLVGGASFGQTALPGDPPDRVGRLSHIEGQVSTRTPDQADWTAAVLNYPVSTGLALWTEPDARAEVSYGDGAIRLDSETAAAVDRLDDDAFDLRLDQGSVQLSVRHLNPNERVAITTPQGRMEALAPGTYRIDAGTGETPAGVTVLDGKARFSDDARSVEVVGGESAIVKEDGGLGTVAAIRRPFDDWALAREAEAKAATVTQRHVPPSMPGHEDLERHGNWVETPEYGAVWYPTAVPADWAPYRYGHWAWVHPWGWTWIDDAPWGFAPFHYGRWAHYHGRWCWVPGRYAHYRPVYAPALVAFIGGSNFSIGISVGRAPAIGWVPLGPREVFYPYYRSSVTYVRKVNVVHVHRTVVNNINVTKIRHGPPQRDIHAFANRHGASVVPVDAMRRAERVHRAMPRHHFNHEDLRGARPTTNLVALHPSRAARAGFATDRDDHGPDRAERPTQRDARAGRPVTNDPDRLPPAPGPRREMKAAFADSAPQTRLRPDMGQDRRGEERRGPQGAIPTRPVQDGNAARLDAMPRAAPDRGPGDRERAPRDQSARDQDSRERIAPPSRPTAPSVATTRREQPQERPAPQGDTAQPQRPQMREQAAPTARGDATARTSMPTVHRPGPEQGQRAPSRADSPRPAAPSLSDRGRTERPTVHTPRPARIEPPRAERQRMERPRAEAPRANQPRMERRSEQARTEQRAAPQRSAPQVERRERSREARVDRGR